MCVSVCPQAYLPNHTRDLYQIVMHVAYGRSSVLLRRGYEIPRGRGQFWGFSSPIDNALYSIAFGTDTKTAEPIVMPFGLMTLVGYRYHLLDGGLDPPRGMGKFGENVAAHCEVMGHSTVCCAKTAEPIDMPFWLKTLVGPRNHVLDGGAVPPRGRGNYRGLSWPFKSIGNLLCNGRCSVAVAFAATGIIQSPIMSCSRQDHSLCQASANSIRKISGRRRCRLSAAKGVVGLHSAGVSLISTIALLISCGMTKCLTNCMVSSSSAMQVFMLPPSTDFDCNHPCLWFMNIIFDHAT